MDYDSRTDRFQAHELAWIARRRQAWAVLAVAPSPDTARALPRRFPWVLMTLGLGVILGAILETGIAAAQQLQLSPQAMQQIQTLHDEKVSRTLAQQKIKSNLVLETKMRRDTALRRAVPALQTNITVDTEDKTLVEITAGEKLDKVDVIYPEGTLYTDKKDGSTFQVYMETATIKATVVRAKGDTKPLNIVIKVNACNDDSCLFPGKVKLSVQ